MSSRVIKPFTHLKNNNKKKQIKIKTLMAVKNMTAGALNLNSLKPHVAVALDFPALSIQHLHALWSVIMEFKMYTF